MKNHKSTLMNKTVKYLFVTAFVIVLSFNSHIQASVPLEKPVTNKTDLNKDINDIVMPSFPGGEKAMMEYIRKNLNYPSAAQKAGIQGRVRISFCISKTGDLVDIVIAGGLYPSCDAEAKRMVQSMPKWIPGKKDGVDVAVSFTLPIVFHLNDQNDLSKDVVYILNGEEISANDLNIKMEENLLGDNKAVLENSALCEGGSLKEYGNKYKGKKVLIMSSTGENGNNLYPEPLKNEWGDMILTTNHLPSFPGGEEAMNKYLNKNVKYPSQASKEIIIEEVLVRFVITKTGEVTNVSILRGVNPTLNAEALRVINNMPKWTPAKLKEEARDCNFVVPIIF